LFEGEAISYGAACAEHFCHGVVGQEGPGVSQEKLGRSERVMLEMLKADEEGITALV
jgi:hypothetical protein